MLPIPVQAARSVADAYGYDQVILIGRRVGEDPAPRGEHVTTYGIDKAHCAAAARAGDFIKHKVMGWPWLENAEAAPDRMAIKLLVAAGLVTEAKANESLNIAHGFLPACTDLAAEQEGGRP